MNRPWPGSRPALAVAVMWVGLLAGATEVAAAVNAVRPVDAHAHHRVTLNAETSRSVVDYAIPNVELVREDGRRVTLGAEINDGRPLVLAFIYTSCTTVCPLTSHVLADLQSKLGSARDQVHIMSVSIDPEYDTPARLRDYARRFGAGPEWQHYTGTLAASQEAQRAFGVFRGDKMNHLPVLLMRPLPSARWVRLDGFATADQVMSELPSYCTTAR